MNIENSDSSKNGTIVKKMALPFFTFFTKKLFNRGCGPDVRCIVQDQGGGPDVRCIVQDQGGG
jgi:hypothetical protein